MLTDQYKYVHLHPWESLGGIVANVLDCGLEVSEFELQLRCYVQFWTNALGKGINSLSLSYGLNSITAVLLQEWL